MAETVVQIVGAMLLLDFLVQAVFARIIVLHFERKPKLRARSYQPRKDAQPFSVRTRDGLVLRGSILRSTQPTPAGVIVFCHEFGGNRWSFQGHCADHVIADYDLVTFDFRNHGASDRDKRYRPSHWLTQFEVNDVEAVVSAIRDRSDWREVPLTLIGVSRGAGAALAAASRCDAAAVTAIGAFSTHELAMTHLLEGIRRIVPLILKVPRWHIRSTLNLAIAWSGLRQRVRFIRLERCVSRLRGQALFIAGGDDSHVPASFQESLARRAASGGFWVVPGGRHNLERDASPEEFDERVMQFLDQHASPGAGVATVQVRVGKAA